MISRKLPHIFFGGDYSPEQWPEEVWNDDVRLMKKAGVNLVTLSVFSWGLIQPDEHTFTFDWLDKVMDLLADNGIFADLGTATAAPPAWMSIRYPDMLPVDSSGLKLSHGSRQSFCPSSPDYRRLSVILTRKMAERYGKHPALVFWHVNNEMSHRVLPCCCPSCATAFRTWLKNKYVSLDTLNATWGTAFWGQTYTDFDQVIPPRKTSAQVNTGLNLDYRRFMSDAYLECCVSEIDVLKSLTPEIPCTTNFLYDFFPNLDYFKWAKKIDFVAVSSFPDPAAGDQPFIAAFNHDLMRSLKGGQPFIALEQAPNNVSWRVVNTHKRPGIMRLWSYQCLAHGSDGAMFFQWRQSVKGSEKFHSAMIPHSGEDSRVYREIVNLGNELKTLDELVDSTVPAEVAILMDYDNMWACEYPTVPNPSIKFKDQAKKYYEALFHLNLPVDVVQHGQDLSRYKVVIAPMMYMVKPGAQAAIEAFVRTGGTFVATFFSGIVDETDTVFAGGYPGPLAPTLGIRVEEYNALAPEIANTMRMSPSFGRQMKNEYRCNLWCDVVKTTTATPVATFAADYHAGAPCLTENRFGRGKAYYVATNPEAQFIEDFLAAICRDAGVTPAIAAPAGVEIVTRRHDSADYIFILNHTAKAVELALPPAGFTDLISRHTVKDRLTLGPVDVAILKRSRT